MGYLRFLAIPRIRKLFEKTSTKKAAAIEACKAFDDSKEEIDKSFEDRKEELQPKALEIYESSPPEIKTLVRERTEAGAKKHAAGINKILEELVKIDFPGAKEVSELSAKFGPALVPDPIFVVFEKVATFLPPEETKEAEPVADADAAEEATPAEKEAEAEAGEEKKAVAEAEAEAGEEKKAVAGEEKKAEETKEDKKAPADPIYDDAPAAPEATTASEAAAAAAPNTETVAAAPAKAAAEGEEASKA